MKNRGWLQCLPAVIIIAVLLLQSFAFATTMVMPGGLEKIEGSAFEGDFSITSVVINSGTTEIGSRTFADTGLKEITIPATVTDIASDAFADCGEISFFAERGSYAYSRIDDLLYGGVVMGKLISTLSIGTNAFDLRAGQTAHAQFTVPSAGIYKFYSTGINDTCASLYKFNRAVNDYECIEYNTDAGEDDNFFIAQYLNAGDRIRLDVGYESITDSGTVTVMAAKANEAQPQNLVIASNPIKVNASDYTSAIMTVNTSGTYRFFSIGEGHTKAILFKYNTAAEAFEQIASDVGSVDTDYKFGITQNLTVGDVIKLYVGYYEQTESGTMTVMVESPEWDYQRLIIGSNPVEVQAGQNTPAKMIAGSSGTYRFCSIGSDDTKATLYKYNPGTAAFEKIAFNDDASEDYMQGDKNFFVEKELNAGDVIRLDVCYYDKSMSGTVTVTVEKLGSYVPPTGTVYRALLIGNTYANDDSALPQCEYDVKTLAGVLSQMETTPYDVTCMYNQNASSILGAIPPAFDDADDNDVSLFYYSGHGVVQSTYDADMNGSLCGETDGHNDSIVTPMQLYNALCKVKGKKIVILDSCGSGNVINKSAKGAASGFDPQEFVDSFMSVFTRQTKAGELANENFYVICACRKTETSYMWISMTHFLTKGSGWTAKKKEVGSWNGRLLADVSPADSALSLSELADYISKQYAIKEYGYSLASYPEGNGQVLFAK